MTFNSAIGGILLEIPKLLDKMFFISIMSGMIIVKNRVTWFIAKSDVVFKRLYDNTSCGTNDKKATTGVRKESVESSNRIEYLL